MQDLLKCVKVNTLVALLNTMECTLMWCISSTIHTELCSNTLTEHTLVANFIEQLIWCSDNKLTAQIIGVWMIDILQCLLCCSFQRYG